MPLERRNFMQNGLLISEIRTKLGLSQLDMAKKLGITLAAYKSYEANLRPMKIQELDFLNKMQEKCGYYLCLNNSV